jgi:signal transduction histidine kinase
VVVLVALEVPLALNLQGRGVAELKARALAQSQSFASAIGDNLEPSPGLARAARQAADQAEGRVVVVDGDGTLVADSERPSLVGTDYATPGRPEIRAALDNRATSQVRSSVELGQDILATAVPVVIDGQVRGAVRLTQSTDGVTRAANRAVIGLVAIGAAGLVGGLILAVALSGSLSRPLRRLAEAARRLGSGDLSSRTEGVDGPREVQELARSFDEMAGRLESTVRAQREFAANASHQLRTPLAGMKLRLESAAAADDPADARRQIRAAEEEVDRLAGIVDRLLDTARRTEAGASAETVELSQAVEAAVGRWRERAEGAGAALSADAGAARARGARADIDQMLDNMIDNAIAYAPGPILVASGLEDGHAVLRVEDRGPGVDPDDAARLGERFYRGRSAPPGGSGLGLAIVRELAERTGGELSIDAAAGGGARVRVLLRAAGDGGSA